MSLWGELPGETPDASGDVSDNLRQVSYTREGADFDVAVDPKGKRVAFASTRHRSTADIYTKSVDGKTVTQLTADPANDVMPSFGPNGQMVAFASDRSGNWDIFLQKLDGGQPIQLTDSPAQELHPSFSPDGQKIIFSSRGQSGRWEMVVVDVDNSAKRRIIGFGLFPEFSPSGDKIAFQRARQRGSYTFGVWTIDYVDGDGKRPTEIAAASNAAVINPTWSPDGKRLAFATVVSPGANPMQRPESADLWAINLDGTDHVKLTSDEHANLQPAWGSDGTVYFVSDRTGWDNIWGLRPMEEPRVASPDAGPAAGEPQAAAPVP